MTFGSERRQATRDVRNAERDARNAEINMLSTAMGVKQKQASDVMDVVEKRRAEQNKQEFEAEQNALQRASTLEYGRLMTQGRGGAGGGGGDKYSDLTAAQRASMVERAYRAWDNMEPSQRRMLEKQGVTEADWVRARTDALMGAATGAAPAAPVNSGGTTRIRFDAQGNMIQ